MPQLSATAFVGVLASAFDGAPDFQVIVDRFSARLAIESTPEVTIQKIEATGARDEPSDTAIEMHEVQHAATLRQDRGAAEILQIEEIEAQRAGDFLDHDVGLLEVAGEDARVMHAT